MREPISLVGAGGVFDTSADKQESIEMDRRILLWTLAVVFALPSLANARKWTDVAGNQISAEYVRVHEGEVILRQGTRIIKCPYDKFSELDKAYLRDQMDAERGRSKRRTGINQIGGPVTPEETDDDARELRTWQDIQGRKILAQYTGFSGGRIELLKDGRRVSYPYAGFSAADQSYVAQILISEGRGDEIPKEKKEGEGGSGEGVSSDEGSYSGEGPMGSSRAGRGPMGGMGPMGGGPMGGSFGPSEPDFEVAGPPSFEPPSFEPPGFHGPNIAGPSMPNPGAMESHVPDFERSHDPIDIGGSGFGTPSRMQEVGICSSCDREVPAHIGAGDNCPHCGVRFDYEEKADGSREYAGPGWNLSRGGRRAVVKLAILGVFIVFGALGALFKRS